MTGPERAAGIDDAAAGWVARHDRGPLGASDAAAFEAWIAADPRHLGAYARAAAVLATFDRARALQAPGGSPAPYEAPAVSRRALLGWGAAAAAAAAGVMLIRQPAGGQAQRYASAVGQLREIALPDGSRLTLGTAAQAVVRYDTTSRRLDLVRGSALFDVAKDPDRRFTVIAGDVSVTALGTSFSVERHGLAGGTLLVRTGVVAVARNGRVPSLARAGERVTWSAGAESDGFEVARLGEEELRRDLAWTQGMLAFEGRTMAEATAEFARYSSFRIMIADPALARRKVSGWFSSRDPRGFAHAAAASLGAVAEDRENAVIIRPAS